MAVLLVLCLFSFCAAAADGGTAVVSFNPNGGTCTVSEKEFVCGEPFGILPIPSRTNYIFVGWFTLPIGGDQILFETEAKQAGAWTLYAHWQGKECTVTFSANGGICSADSKTVRFGEKYGELPAVTREGYQFIGWYTAPKTGQLVTENTVVSNTMNHAIYPHWEPNAYLLYLDADGGQCDAARLSVFYGEPIGALPVV